MRFLKILWPSYNIWTLIGSLSFRNLSSCSRSKQESFLSSSQHHFLVFSHISQILLLFTSAAFWWDSSLKKMSTVCPRADLNNMFLPRPKTTTAWKLIPHRSKISKNWNPPHWDPLHRFFKNCFLLLQKQLCSNYIQTYFT